MNTLESSDFPMTMPIITEDELDISFYDSPAFY